MPSIDAARDKTYPIARPLYYYYDSVNEAKVKTFIDWILTPDGQAVVKEVGYVPL